MDRTTEILDDLENYSNQLMRLGQTVSALRTEMLDARAFLSDAQETLDLTETDATMDAYAKGIINGKNQAERDLQLKAHLNGHLATQQARKAHNDAEAGVAALQARIDAAETDYKTTCYLVRARIAMAELQAATVAKYDKIEEEEMF